MKGFFRPKKFYRPMKIDEAVSLLTEYGRRASPIAGGTDLLVEKPPEVECLIDITRLPLNYIERDEEGIKIGALTTLRNIEICAFMKGAYGIVADAAHQLGNLSIRNVATIGGNLCNAAPSAEMPPPLMALDTKVKIVGPTMARVISLEGFFVHVGKTVLKNDELLAEIQIPSQPDHAGASFLKLCRQQTSRDIALVNVAVRVMMSDGACEDARIVLGAVAPTPVRAKKAEMLLKGKTIDNSLIEEVAETASMEIKPISDIRTTADYRKEMSNVLVRRALKQALDRAKSRR